MTASRTQTGSFAIQAARILGLALAFLSTRVLIYLSLRLDSVSFVINDISYYGAYLFQLIETGDRSVMAEYPVPAVWILQAIYQFGGGWETWTPWYMWTFLVLDLLVAVSLYRRRNAWACLFWILFTGAQGAIVWARFDLVPAALVAWACMLVMTHPRLAGGFVGLGAAIKLWPALLIGPLLAPDPIRDRLGRRRLFGFIIVGFGLAAASLLTSGWARSASPITWQGERGLQIESIPATPLMFLRTFTDNASWNIDLSEFNALEILSGQPGVELMLRVSTVLTALSIIMAVYLSYRLIRNLRTGDPRLAESINLAVLTLILATIIANKTLSPQYILWLGGPVAALILLRSSHWLRRHVNVLAVSLLLVAGMTQFTYPWGAFGIMAIPNGAGPETSVLILRNIALVLLTGYTFWLTMAASRREGDTLSAPIG